METRKPYPTDVRDEEWAFVAPYLTLITPAAPQRDYSLREVFNALRWIVRAGAPWRLLPHEFPPWHTVYDQTHRWLKAGSFEAIVHDLRELLRVAQGRNAQPSAVILDARTLQSTPESGARAGYDGHKRKKGSKTHAAVDTLGHLLAMVVTPANEQERAQVAELAEAVQAVTGDHVELAFVDQGYTGLLRLADLVARLQAAQAVRHEEGGMPCPEKQSSRFPPAPDGTPAESLGADPTSESSASPVASESDARASIGPAHQPEGGGR
jgi:transposase